MLVNCLTVRELLDRIQTAMDQGMLEPGSAVALCIWGHEPSARA